MMVKSALRDYPVHFAETTGFLAELENYPQRCYVVDENVWRLYGDGCLSGIDRRNVLVLPIAEERKCLEMVQQIYDTLMERSAKRNMTLISIGGGILQDVSGFAASTLYRGVNWVFVPTTLLAQADSCIGSKTSLNYKGYKNIIGSFYPPSKVFVHAAFLQTQGDVDFRSGLGEVVKLHAMGGEGSTAEMVSLLPAILRREPAALLKAVRNSLRIKYSYIADDEFDTGRRNLLNFGHCFGHALEATSAFEIPHGQAVVLGMVLAGIVANKRGLLSPEFQSFLNEALLLPSLAVRPAPEHLAVDAVVAAMKKDKKRTGEGLPLILLTDDYGMHRVDDLTEREVAAALSDLAGVLAG